MFDPRPSVPFRRLLALALCLAALTALAVPARAATVFINQIRERFNRQRGFFHGGFSLSRSTPATVGLLPVHQPVAGVFDHPADIG
jgi:hypothetical protein